MSPNYKKFPLFVLAFCIINRTHYADFVVPELLRIKLKYFQEPDIIFHERDIRKAQAHFQFLTCSELRSAFYNDLNNFMQSAQFTVIATVIHKENHRERYSDPANPYTLATQFCLERLKMFLDDKKAYDNLTITFEARGKKKTTI